jgi:hypothetical protein
VASQSVANGTQFSTSALPRGGLSWRVRAVNSAGTAGAWSAVRIVTVR